MDEKIENFLERCAQKEIENRENRKKKFLLKYGVYDLEPVSGNEFKPGCITKTDEVTGNVRYYEPIFPQISDEEFEEMENRAIEAYKDVKEYSDDIRKNDKYYRIFKKIPFISMIITFALFFIWSIVDPCVFQFSYSGETRYGMMMLSSGFLCWFIWTLIGAIAGLFIYFAYKIILSPIILHIEYQKLVSTK